MPNNEPSTKADIENILALLQHMNERMDQRFDGVDRRLEALENRVNKLGDGLAGLQMQMSGMTRWSERLDREQGAVLGTQKAQQSAIDSLAARVTQIERRQQN